MHPNATLRPLVRVSKKLQRSLSESLDALETCTSLVRSKMLAWAILDLYEKANHLVLVIGVLERLNEELVHFKRKASKVKDGKAKPALRQRIKRLEKAMATVIEQNFPGKLDKLLELPLPKVQQSTEPSQSATSHSIVPSISLPFRVQKSPAMKQVTIVTGVTIPEDEEIKPHEDESDVYWSTGHHRFLHFPDKDWYHVIRENDLSYQNLHLVGPANFVSPMSAEYIADSTLPWLTEQDVYKRNFDILVSIPQLHNQDVLGLILGRVKPTHFGQDLDREDLERVLRRTRKLQDKVWKAANLSVKFSKSHGRDRNEERKLLQTWQPGDRGFTAASSRTDITGTTSSMRSSSLKSAYQFLGGGMDFMTQTKDAGTEHHQLTRLNMHENFPHTCDRWTGAMPDPYSYMSQPAIANQGNLYNQTKLRLFVPEREKKKAMVKRDLITPDSIFSSHSFRGVASSIRFLNKLKSRGESGLSRLRKNRLDDLVETVLKSNIVRDRVDAAKSLCDLGAADVSAIVPALNRAVLNDPSSDVIFQASKALLHLGFWPQAAIKEFTSKLCTGDTDVQIDVMENISSAAGVRSLFSDSQDSGVALDLVKVLRKKAIANDFGEKVAFLAAVCLVELCGLSDSKSSEIAQKTLRNIALSTNDQDIRATSLEVLIRHLDLCDDEIFQVVLKNLGNAIKWRDRLAAALLIAYLGQDKLEEIIDEESMYEILRHKIWDDAKREVRLGVSQAITALGMRPRLLEDLDRALRDANEEARTRAVIAMSAAGIHTDATLRYLVEMLDLDASDYVRLQIIRTFQALNVTDLRVVRAIRERERAGGPLAKAAQKYLIEFDIWLPSPKTARRPQDSRESKRLPSARSSLFFRTGTANTISRGDTMSRSPHKSIRRDSESSSVMTKRISIISTAVRKSPRIQSGTRLPTTDSKSGILGTLLL